jgi:hypothetical protein
MFPNGMSSHSDDSSNSSDLSDSFVSSHSSSSSDTDSDLYSTGGSTGDEDDVGDLSSLSSDCDDLTSTLAESFEHLKVKDTDDRFDHAMMHACNEHFDNILHEFNAKKKYKQGPEINDWFIDECCTVFGDVMHTVRSPMPGDAVVYRLRELMEPLLIEGYLIDDQIFELAKDIYMRYKSDRGPDMTIERLEEKYGTTNHKKILPFNKRDVTHKPKPQFNVIGKHDGKRRNFEFFTETTSHL